MKENNISNEEIELLNKYFRAANYLSAGQLYLLNNPLLREPLKITDIKKNLWYKYIIGNFLCLANNKAIKKTQVQPCAIPESFQLNIMHMHQNVTCLILA